MMLAATLSRRSDTSAVIVQSFTAVVHWFTGDVSLSFFSLSLFLTQHRELKKTSGRIGAFRERYGTRAWRIASETRPVLFMAGLVSLPPQSALSSCFSTEFKLSLLENSPRPEPDNPVARLLEK